MVLPFLPHLRSVWAAACLVTLVTSAAGAQDAPRGEQPRGSSVTTTQAEPRAFLDPVGEFFEDSVLRPKTPFELVPGKNPHDWGFSVMPYFWLTSVSGTTGVGSLPPLNVNASVKKLLQNLDWGVAGMVEVRKGRWGVLGDGYYAQLSGSGDLGGNIYSSGSMTLQQAFASLAVAYRIMDDRRGFLDVYAGARYNYLGLQMDLSTDAAGIARISNGVAETVSHEVESAVLKQLAGDVDTAAQDKLSNAIRSQSDLRSLIDSKALRRKFDSSRRALSHFVKAEARANVEPTKENRATADQAKRDFADALAKDLDRAVPDSGDGSQTWVDPLVGLRAQINFTRWLYLTTQADVGGFGAGSQIAWNALAALGVNFTRNVYAELGYRYMYVDYNEDDFLYQMNTYGLYASLGFSF